MVTAIVEDVIVTADSMLCVVCCVRVRGFVHNMQHHEDICKHIVIGIHG
jgi:hypothetical protein